MLYYKIFNALLYQNSLCLYLGCLSYRNTVTALGKYYILGIGVLSVLSSYDMTCDSLCKHFILSAYCLAGFYVYLEILLKIDFFAI